MTMTTRHPEPMTPAAAARPRDPSGRVLMPLRIEVKFTRGRGFRKFFTDWDQVAQWMASAEFTGVAPVVKSMTVVRPHPDPGPAVDRTAR